MKRKRLILTILSLVVLLSLSSSVLWCCLSGKYVETAESIRDYFMWPTYQRLPLEYYNSFGYYPRSMDEAVDFYQQTYWPNMAKKDLRAQQFLTDPFARDGGEFLYIPLYDYYKKHKSYPDIAELKEKLNCFRDLIAYRIVISMPRCHLKNHENREEEELKHLYQIANVLPQFLEERGFTAELTGGVLRSSSLLLDDAVKPYYRDYITSEKEDDYKSLHITFYDNSARCYVEMQLRTKQMDDIAEIGSANHINYEKKQEASRARRDTIPEGECIYFDEAYERCRRLQELELSGVDVDMFTAVSNSLMNDGCGLYRGRLILPYEHLSRFQK